MKKLTLTLKPRCIAYSGNGFVVCHGNTEIERLCNGHTRRVLRLPTGENFKLKLRQTKTKTKTTILELKLIDKWWHWFSKSSHSHANVFLGTNAKRGIDGFLTKTFGKDKPVYLRIEVIPLD